MKWKKRKWSVVRKGIEKELGIGLKRKKWEEKGRLG